MRTIIIVLCSVVILSSLNNCYVICSNVNHRVKRKVVFTKNSKLFFRLNGKANIIPGIQIFANGYAVRINWDLPETFHRRHLFFKRDINDFIEEIESKPLLKGYYCVLKHVCLTVAKFKEEKDCQMFCRLGNIISRSEDSDATFFRSILDKCDVYMVKCPYSLGEMTPSNDY